MFLDGTGTPVSSRSLTGPLACGVPGSVAGLSLAQRKYGRLTLAQVIAPAIALARDGFRRELVARRLARLCPAETVDLQVVDPRVPHARRFSAAGGRSASSGRSRAHAAAHRVGGSRMRSTKDRSPI
jgi:hypothetical protein